MRRSAAGVLALLVAACAGGASDDATSTTAAEPVQTTVTTAPTTVVAAADEGEDVVRWRVDALVCSDGLAAGDGLVVFACSESLVAFDSVTGEHRWNATIEDTGGGGIPMAIADGLVLVAAQGAEDASAYDVATGSARGTAPLPASPDLGPPPGYELDAGRLRVDGIELASGLTEYVGVGRVGDLTVVNDFDRGLVVIAADGTVLFESGLGEPYYDEGPVVVDAALGLAFAATADGVVWAIGPPR